ncbi:DUF928 domain-containing protein [Trichothermofontia sp.]
MRNQYTYRQLALVGLGTVLLVTTLLLPAVAQRRNLPGRRVAAGTRGECLLVQPGQQTSLPLVTLLPASNLSFTTQAQPEFFWFNPKMLGQTVVFQLYAVDDHLQGQRLLYESPIAIGDRVGLHSFQLPTDGSVPPLAVGQLYQWSITPQCSDEAERNLVWRVTGWVEPIAPPEAPATGSLEEQALAAAQADRWLDAFSLLKQAMCEAPRPAQPAVIETWTTLLDKLQLEQAQIDLPLLKKQAIAGLDSLCE